jgi:excisionase family DNA binding protein
LSGDIRKAVVLCFKGFYSRDEVAELLSISNDTVDKMGLPFAPIFPGSKLLRVSRNDLQAHMERMRGPACPA